MDQPQLEAETVNSTVRTGPVWGNLTLYLLSIGVLALCLLILQPFLASITAAIALAVVTEPLHRRLRRRFKSRTVAAVLALAAVLLSVIVPFLFLAQSILGRAFELVYYLQTQQAAQQFRGFVDQYPQLVHLLAYTRANIDAGQLFQSSIGSVAAQLGPLLGGSISAAFQIAILLFLLFFLYRDQQQVIATVRSLLPFTDEESGFLLGRLRASVNALVMGRFAVAAIQGLLSGILFAMVGLQSSVLLGVATMFSSMVPAIGAVVVWLPVALYLLLIHQWVQALIVALVSSVVISSLDNVLYPIFVGTRIRLHTVPVFLSMMGGVTLFGIMGLVLGPVIFNIATVLSAIWRKRIDGLPLPTDN